MERDRLPGSRSQRMDGEQGIGKSQPPGKRRAAADGERPRSGKNPNGISSISPALPRQQRGYAGWTNGNGIYPERG